MKLKLLTVILAAVTLTGFAGEPTPPPPLQLAPKVAENPLSFYNGKLIFDFQERLRFEYRDNNYDFNSAIDSPTDDSWLLQRARLGVKITPNDWFTFYAQAESSFEFGSDRLNIPGVFGAEGDDPIALQQGYFKFGKKDLNVTIGRMALVYGDQRLIGDFDWNNFGRTFDAVKVHYGTDTWNIEAFASSVVIVDSDGFNQSDWFNGNGTGRDQVFSGLYFTSVTLLPNQVTDLYALDLYEQYPVGDTNFITLGTRMKADPVKLNGFDYETEMAVQFGEVKGQNLNAFAGHWGVGYVWLKHDWKPRIGIQYNYATGDSNAADDEVGTFQNLFPTNHKFYGYMDLFSWENLSNPGITFSVEPTKKIKLQVDYNAFWLANVADGWYRANGVTKVRPINKTAIDFVGTELDLTAIWKATKNLNFLVGYSHFFSGPYAEATGPNDPANFAYVQATVTF